VSKGKQFEFVKAEQRSPEWHALRKGGITATDVTVIAGLSPYKTPYQLWCEKLGKVEPEPAGAAAQRGIILEDAVATFYELETGRKLKRSNGIVRVRVIPWAMASLDRTVVGEPGLVEIKTSASPRWSMYPVPPEVVAQVQWQMFVTKTEWCDVAVLLGGLVFRIERVKADWRHQTELFVKAEEFRKMLEEEVAPPLTGNDSKTLALVTPQESEEWAQADAGIDRLAALYAERSYELKILEQEVDNLGIGLKEAIGAKQGIVGQGWQATWKQSKPRQSVDYKLLLEALKPAAEIVNAYTKETPGARVFKFRQEGIGE
jgi:putative phage-type endonuclease